jgi:signal transduction histidine kinase
VLHGRPAKIELKICFAKSDLTLEVRDDGSGFDPSVILSRQTRHYGLVGMKERVQAVGGRFHLASKLGEGTYLRVQIPRKVSVPQTVMLGA